LKKIDIPLNITKIEINAFRSCEGLEEIRLHPGIEIHPDAFAECLYDLKSFINNLTITKSITILRKNETWVLQGDGGFTEKIFNRVNQQSLDQQKREIDLILPTIFDFSTLNLITNVTTDLTTGEEVEIIADADIQVDVYDDQFSLRFTKINNTIEFIDGSKHPFDSMTTDDPDWTYYAKQKVGNYTTTTGNVSQKPGCLLIKTWTDRLDLFPSKTNPTNLQSIIIELIADNYFSHPFTTAAISNMGEIAEKINTLIESFETAWSSMGSGGDVDPFLDAKKSILDQFVMGGDDSDERFEVNNDIVTFRLLEGDSLSFLVYFNNTVENTAYDNVFKDIHKTIKIVFKMK